MDIYETQKILHKLDEYNDECDNINTQIAEIKYPLTKKRLGSFSALYWGVIAFVLLAISTLVAIMCPEEIVGNDAAITPIWEAFAAQLSFLVFLFPGGLFPLVFCVAFRILKAIEKKRKLNYNEQEQYNEYNVLLLEKQLKIQELSNELELSEIPQQYQYSVAVDWMVEALKRKRADSIKEVINLFEQFITEERRHQELLDVNRELLNNSQFVHHS